LRHFGRKPYYVYCSRAKSKDRVHRIGGGGPIAEAVAEIGGWGGILLDLGNDEAAEEEECAGGKYTALDFSLLP